MPSTSKSKKDPRLARAGVAGFNKPKRTPNHAKKSHVVVAKVDENYEMIKPMWQDFLVRSARNDESWNDEFSSFNTSRKDK